MTLAELKANWRTSPKSTITGVCGLAIAIIIAIAALPPKAGFSLVAVAVLRAVVDFTKQDAGKQLAQVPGQVNPVLVPSHETPDDPEATPIKS